MATMADSAAERADYTYDYEVDDDPAAERSLVEDVLALVDDGKMLAEAEIDFQKKRAVYVAGQAKGITVLFVAAAVFGFLALIALTVGLVMALGPIITFWGSTAVVTGLWGILALILASKGAARIRKVQSVIGDGGEQ